MHTPTDEEESVCPCCNGEEVIEVSKSGHPLDPDAREVPCPECKSDLLEGPDPDSLWDSRVDKEYDDVPR